MAVNKLKHSSSISNLAFTEGAGGVSGFGEGGWQKMGVLIDLYTRQMRTCSLPIEAKKELRKRKELQSMRWIEAKRKRFEKLKNGRVLKKKKLTWRKILVEMMMMMMIVKLMLFEMVTRCHHLKDQLDHMEVDL
ncbi:ninja-family AFP3-like [Olea europaea subsp. europaea]|uniref:Ninja-family AFP3-like n=1 Tax=Olea europaea subsp. europaea TaxID=158383 RepID=A0A8S0TVN6_OLEEU|nr:ninja-family AFP3-like [Olea europaea subsp. europaea]